MPDVTTAFPSYTTTVNDTVPKPIATTPAPKLHVHSTYTIHACPTRLSSATYLYRRRAELLLFPLLIAPPASLYPVPHDEDTPELTPEQWKEERCVTLEHVHRLARTETPGAACARPVAGCLCARWEVIDVAWRMLLRAIALGTGESVDGVLGPEGVEA
ncbi:hypothetical protein H0H81_005194 [Sphagnurus paluster]|uniref:Uncharacterized protein n=1 Tax=Sphagnurus paluster TaxID=117069 RepID=A0A9P7K6Z6_9AGAR|nr:hypothetical protein H0H81_005194 [Sphagnurus paluster]